MRTGTLLVLFVLALPSLMFGGEEKGPFERQIEVPEWRIQIAPNDLQFLLDNPTLDEYRPCQVTVDKQTYRGEMRVRGNSSRLLPKKSWKIKLSGSGISGRKKFYLNGMLNHSDPYNSNLVYAMARAAGVVAPKASYVELFINDRLWGLYLDQEDLTDKQALREHGFHENSNVYRSNSSIIRDSGDMPIEWKKNTNESEPWDDLEEFVRVVNRTDQHRLEAEWPSLIDLDSQINLLCWHAIIAMLFVTDADYYYIHDRNTGLWYTVVHDGKNGRNRVGGLRVWEPRAILFTHTAYAHFRGMPERPHMPWSHLWSRILSVPAFRERLVNRLRELYEIVLKDQIILSYLEDLRALALPYIRRDPFFSSEPTLYDRQYMSWRNFIPQRREFVLEHLIGIETISRSDIKINEVLPLNAGSKLDEYGDANPFVELINVTDQDITLSGMLMGTYMIFSETPWQNLWRIPDGVILPARGYLVIWADGHPEQGPTHAPFRLEPYGGIFLFREVPYRGDLGPVRSPWLSEYDHGTVDFLMYGPQPEGRSCGRVPNGNETWMCGLKPTPGEPN